MSSLIQTESAEQLVASIRHFNRLYAQKIGALSENVFGSHFSLTEIRVLHEIFILQQTTATVLSRNLALDCGYVSRILNSFEKQELITKERSVKDARQRKICMTKEGQKVWGQISGEADRKVIDMLSPLSSSDQGLLVSAMNTIVKLLSFDVAHARIEEENALSEA